MNVPALRTTVSTASGRVSGYLNPCRRGGPGIVGSIEPQQPGRTCASIGGYLDAGVEHLRIRWSDRQLDPPGGGSRQRRVAPWSGQKSPSLTAVGGPVQAVWDGTGRIIIHCGARNALLADCSDLVVEVSRVDFQGRGLSGEGLDP